jgi:hypothetical protein|nr:MAG TPA: hypothetical protein [Caudoviricetes sp.]
MAKEKFIEDLEEALKKTEERGFEPEETQEERNERFAKMTPEEIRNEILKELREFRETEEEEEGYTYE